MYHNWMNKNKIAVRNILLPGNCVKGALLFYFRGNTEQFCIVDRYVLGTNNTNGKYGRVFLATVITRTLHHITLYVHCQSFWNSLTF
jgi:hypothetical protein